MCIGYVPLEKDDSMLKNVCFDLANCIMHAHIKSHLFAKKSWGYDCRVCPCQQQQISQCCDSLKVSTENGTDHLHHDLPIALLEGLFCTFFFSDGVSSCSNDLATTRCWVDGPCGGERIHYSFSPTLSL